MNKASSLLLALLLILSACGSGTMPMDYSEISVTKARELITSNHNLTVLDVRTPGEFNAGHLPHAVNIDINHKDFELLLDGLDRDKTYLLYCRTGRRSGIALKIMKKLEFKTVLHMNSGIREWTKRGLSLDK